MSELFTDYTVRVLDQKERPVAGCNLTINGKACITNAQGEYTQHDHPYTLGDKIRVTLDGENMGDFPLSQNPARNVFTIRYEQEKSRWWIWVLALMAFILLCFVRCEHTINVDTVDAQSGERVDCDSITLAYTAHYLYKDGQFFASESQSFASEPDDDGIAHFSGMPCSVFSYIFYAFSRAEYTVCSSCYDLNPSPAKSSFHYRWNKTLEIDQKTTDLVLTVVDRETADPLPDALLEYSYLLHGAALADTVTSDAAGRCILYGVPVCGDVKVSRASCYAYNDTTDVNIFVAEALQDEELTKIPLTPLKESFTFKVLNLYTEQPIPNASYTVTLKNRNNTVRSQPISTNVDGVGRGAYKDAPISAVLELRASHPNYHDSIFTPICTVEEFVHKSEAERVVKLRPKTQLQEFVNVDSITHNPIPGVNNTIVIESVDGHTYTPRPEISNTNGVFYVKAIPDDHIIIDSKLDPLYYPKHTDIPHFAQGETILMRPIAVDVDFRTILAHTGNLLPDCRLSISTTKSGVHQPTNSGNGAFTVRGLFPSEHITIVASKPGFDANDYTVRNALVSDLMAATSDRRDIPLDKEMLPCDGGNTCPKNGNEHVNTKTYNMGRQSGTTTISCDFYSLPDYITVYDGPDTTYPVIVSRRLITNSETLSVSFNNGSLTVVMETGPAGNDSNWQYRVHCP